MKDQQEELMSRLKQAVLDDDNEVVHHLYDKIILMRLRQHDPNFVSKLDKIVEGINFWYA